MRWMLLLSMAGAGTLEPMLEPAAGAAFTDRTDAPLSADAPVLRAEEAPATPASPVKSGEQDQRLIVAVVLLFAAAAAVTGTVLCCCCFAIYGYY